MAHNGANTPARAMHTAALQADVDELRYALSAGTPVDVREEDFTRSQITPLMRLCQTCFDAGRNDEASIVACAELLLAAGAYVDAPDSDGDTPLGFAAGGVIPRLVQVLLDAGANPNAVGGDGWTPLHWASRLGCIENVALLIQHGAAVNAKAAMDKTPLLYARDRRNYRMYPILLRAGASLPTFTINDAYIQRVIAAGGWAKYERLHLDRLTAMLTPRRGPSSPLRRVPPEVIRRIAAYAFHAGYY